ncbi:hypothetical protein ACVIGA_000603 [Bradyrhizobium sp. USDA 3240]
MWQRPSKSLHQAPDLATAVLSPCTAISKPDLKSRLNRASRPSDLGHSRFLSFLRQGPLRHAATRCTTPTASPEAPSTLPRSATASRRCSKAARTLSRRTFPSTGRSHVTGIPAWSGSHIGCVATGKIACVPSSLICTRSLPLSRSSVFKTLRSSGHRSAIGSGRSGMVAEQAAVLGRIPLVEIRLRC